MSPADFSALMGGNNRGNYGGWGDFGGQGWWILLLFLFAGGWNNNGWGNRGGSMPYVMNQDTQADIQRGFDQQATQSTLANIQSQIGNGFADAAVAQCQGNANITAAITNGQYETAQAITNGQYATAQAITGAKDAINGTLYANQLANNQTMNQLAMNLQNCCCQTQSGIESLRYTIAQENCADRQAINTGVRDIIASNTANTQAIINSQTQGFQAIQDKLCQLELDSYKQKAADQAAEIIALKGAISQTAQTAQIIQDNNAQTANLIRAINPAPIPAYQVPNPVTGCCGQNYYGCGCAG